MEVVLAGHNIDASVLAEAEERGTRRLAGGMSALAEESAPLSSLLLCGKDRFVERYERVFGRKPRIDPAALEA